MSTDPKIELFGLDLFNAIWEHHGLKDPPEFKPPPVESEFNYATFCAVQIRQSWFRSAYHDLFEKIHVEFVGNSTDFFDAITDHFPHYLDTEDPEDDDVMGAFLSSCAFVAEICLWTKSKRDDFLGIGHKAWAMFVDLNLLEDFYKAGGWEKLHLFVTDDCKMHHFISWFSDYFDDKFGRNVFWHSPHLTSGAIHSFIEFKQRAKVDRNVPLALNWVDYCVENPFTEIPASHLFQKGTPEVFKRLKLLLGELNYVVDPDKDEDYSHESEVATTAQIPEPSGTNASADSGTVSHLPDSVTRNKNYPITQRKGSDHREKIKLRVNSPEVITHSKDDAQKITIIKLSPAETNSMVGGQKDSLVDPKHELDSSCAITKVKPCSEFAKKNHADKETNDSRQTVQNQTDNRTDKDNSESNYDGENLVTDDSGCISNQDGICPGDEHPIQSHQLTSLSENTLATDENLNKDVPDLLSNDVVISRSAKSNFLSTKNLDETRMSLNTDFNANMGELRLEKQSSCTPVDSITNLYAPAFDLSNSPIPDECTKETRKTSLYTPRKSPLTSPNVSILSTPDSVLIKTMNTSGGTKSRRSGGKENSPSMLDDSPKVTRKTSLYTPRKSPLTSPNVSISGTPDSIPIKTTNTSLGTESRRSGRKEKSPSYQLKTETKKKKQSPYQRLKVSSSASSSKEVKKSNLEKILKSVQYAMKCATKDIEGNIRIGNVFSLNGKTFDKLKEPILAVPLHGGEETPENDQVTGKKSIKDEPTRKKISQNKLKSFPEDEEDEKILEESLRKLDSNEKDEMSGFFRDTNRSTSADGSSIEIRKITKEGKNSAEPTSENFPSGSKLGRDESLQNTEYETTSAANENSEGVDGKRGKKKKSKTALDSIASTCGVFQAPESATTTAESVLENPFGFPENAEKKGKNSKKKSKKRLTRLQERVKEGGNGIYDVTRLIFVLGHQPGIEYVLSTRQDSEVNEK